jgi:hypothetical protein
LGNHLPSIEGDQKEKKPINQLSKLKFSGVEKIINKFVVFNLSPRVVVCAVVTKGFCWRIN